MKKYFKLIFILNINFLLLINYSLAMSTAPTINPSGNYSISHYFVNYDAAKLNSMLNIRNQTKNITMNYPENLSGLANQISSYFVDHGYTVSMNQQATSAQKKPFVQVIMYTTMPKYKPHN